ncbi:HPr family phosphocarrier protein [Streptomyces hygroscopicus]|uniref:HPr family phosphocarrier protein n=1 Tax=Streptomyces hygroscopicus TaxID=1912 RepID=UPI0033D0FAF1
MNERTVVVASASGLHARPAKIFATAAAGTGVKIARGSGTPVDASSILRVMALGIAHGDTVTLSTDGDESALDSLAALLATDLDAA